MPKWNEYTEKELPVDNDILMIEDSENSVNKILKLKKLADWIVGKVKKCIPDLENHTAVSDGDYVILGQVGDAKKITVAELKQELGINAEQKLLSDSPAYMNASQTITLSEKISAQKNGIVLVFSEYGDGEVKNAQKSCFFVPKTAVSLLSGIGFVFSCGSPFDASVNMNKYLYITDTTIKGNDLNSSGGNLKYVLQYVIGC